MTNFTSAFLGEVQHPKNVLREYLTAFGNKCQADILSWLDGWTLTKRSQDKQDWVRVVTSKLATTLGYCKATICTHLNKLQEMGVLERKEARLFPCDQAYEYRIVESELALHIDKNQSVDGQKLVHREAKASPSTDQKQSITELDTDGSEVQNTTAQAAVTSARAVQELPPQMTASLSNWSEPASDEPKANAQDSNSAPNVEAILNVVESAGIPLNAQLKHTVLAYTLEQVQAAIAHYRSCVKAHGRRDNPPGWLTECLRGQWWKSASTGVLDEYPEGFLEVYQRLIAAGVVEDVPPKWLPRSMGDIEVRVINPNPQPGEHPYGLMWWRDALALLEDGGD